MKMRGLILLTAAMVVTTTSVIMYQPEASIRDAYETARPVEVPYLDLTINQYKEQQNYAKANRAESDVANGDHAEADADRGEAGQDPDVFDDGAGAAGEDSGGVEAGEDPESMPELVESEPDESDGGSEDSVLTYLGEWTTTAYCPCEICCGPWATGYTASGRPAISGHTVACNSLPFYSRVIIDGVEYTVEDTGSTDYGEAWIDIYFDTHEEALAYGVQTKSIYLLEE